MVSLQQKTKPDSYPELAKVNHAEIRWKEYALNWGGLTDVAIRQVARHSEPRSNACREKSAEAIVPIGKKMGKDRTLLKLKRSSCDRRSFEDRVVRGGGETIMGINRSFS